jgi:hypothetical protein
VIGWIIVQVITVPQNRFGGTALIFLPRVSGQKGHAVILVLKRQKCVKATNLLFFRPIAARGKRKVILIALNYPRQKIKAAHACVVSLWKTYKS